MSCNVRPRSEVFSTLRARSTLLLILAALAGCNTAPAPRQAGSGSVTLSAPLQTTRDGLRNFGEVRAGQLYRGAQPDTDPGLGLDGYKALIEQYRIRTIVDLMNGPIDHWIKRRRGDCARMTPSQRKSVKYVAIPAYEPFPSRTNLIKFLRIFEKPENRPLFVHCVDGENRTGAMVAGFRVVEDGWQPVDAEAEMTNFDVLQIWKGANDGFIDGLAKDRDALRSEVAGSGGEQAAVVDCSDPS